MKFQLVLLAALFGTTFANPLLYRRSGEQTTVPAQPAQGPSSATPGTPPPPSPPPSPPHSPSPPPETHPVGSYILHDSTPWHPDVSTMTNKEKKPVLQRHWSVIHHKDVDADGNTRLHLATLSAKHPGNPHQVPVAHIHPDTTMGLKEGGTVSLHSHVLNLGNAQHVAAIHPQTNAALAHPNPMSPAQLTHLQGYIADHHSVPEEHRAASPGHTHNAWGGAVTPAHPVASTSGTTHHATTPNAPTRGRGAPRAGRGATRGAPGFRGGRGGRGGQGRGSQGRGGTPSGTGS